MELMAFYTRTKNKNKHMNKNKNMSKSERSQHEPGVGERQPIQVGVKRVFSLRRRIGVYHNKLEI